MNADIHVCTAVWRLTLSLLRSSRRSACPGQGEGANFTRSAATCGNDACAAAISAIDDAALSLMRTGFEVLHTLFCACFARACQHGKDPEEAHRDTLTHLGPHVCRTAPLYPTPIP